MRGQTVILAGPTQKKLAHDLIDRAPRGAVLNVREKGRTNAQNDRMWAMLSDVSRAKPEGRCLDAETWKAIFMQGLGHEIKFIMGLQGQPFPLGFSSKRLGVSQMADLITFIQEYGDRMGVKWSEPNPYE